MLKETPKNKRQTHLENLGRATVVARQTILILIVLTIIKAFGGYVTNIVTLLGDAVGSFADLIAATAIYVGLKLSQQKANARFKYGYHRVETFISLCISLIIMYAGYKILRESYNRFFETAETGAHSLGIATSFVSIVLSLFSYYIQRKTGKSINSTALLASADDKRNDAFVSGGVLVSIITDKMGIPYVEGVISFGMAILIMITGLKYAKEALSYLLDYWDEPGITAQIKAILTKSKIVTAVKNIRLRHAGTYIFGEAFLSINPFTDSKDLRDEIHRLDNEVEKNVEHLGDLVLYIDPPKPQLVRVAIPIVTENGLHSIIAENPADKFKFLFVEIQNGKIKKHYTLDALFSVDQIAPIAKFLKEQKANILISSMIRPLLYYNLRLNNIKVYPHFLEVHDVENTVKLLLLDI